MLNNGLLRRIFNINSFISTDELGEYAVESPRLCAEGAPVISEASCEYGTRAREAG